MGLIIPSSYSEVRLCDANIAMISNLRNFNARARPLATVPKNAQKGIDNSM